MVRIGGAMITTHTGYKVKRKCPICNKTFYTYGAEWGYTCNLKNPEYAPIYFCSYSCMRKHEIPIIEKYRREIQERDELAWLEAN